jgi:hypothetical protein
MGRGYPGTHPGEPVRVIHGPGRVGMGKVGGFTRAGTGKGVTFLAYPRVTCGSMVNVIGHMQRL